MNRSPRVLLLAALLSAAACGAEPPPPADAPRRLAWHEFREMLTDVRAGEYQDYRASAPRLVQVVLDGLTERAEVLGAARPELRALVEPVDTGQLDLRAEDLPGPVPERLPERLHALVAAALPAMTPAQEHELLTRLGNLAVEGSLEILSHAIEAVPTPRARTLAAYAPPAYWPLGGEPPADLYAWFRRMQRRPLSRSDPWDRRVGDELVGQGAAWPDGEVPVRLMLARVMRELLKVPDIGWGLLVQLKYGPAPLDPGLRALVDETMAAYLEVASDRVMRAWPQAILYLNDYLSEEYARDPSTGASRGGAAASAEDRSGPSIEVLSPTASRGPLLVEDETTCEVVVRVEDPSGVREVTFGGVAVTRGEDGLWHGSLCLQADRGQLRIRAEDTLGNVRTRTAQVVRAGEQAVLEAPPEARSYALLVGIDDYDDWPHLRNPVNDVTTLKQVLVDTYGWDPADVELVENPTKVELLARIDAYMERAFAPGDQLLFVFAGHGCYDEPPRDRGHVVLRDSRHDDRLRVGYLSHNELLDLLTGVPCDHLLVVLDACFGGAAFGKAVAPADERGQDPYADVSVEELMTRKAKLRTRKLITSGGVEYVPDGRPGQHSPFARRLLERLRTLDGRAAGVITYHDLVAALSMGQPGAVEGELPGDDPGSDFLFLKR